MGRDLGLTARDMSDMGRLAELAANPQGTTREEIFLAVASLYRLQGGYLNERERALMQDILRMLARDVEMAIRIALAERLADDTTAPHDLILLLADDRIEVARPVILRSPLLTEADVLKMIAEAGHEHHAAVASRANIGEPVTDALVKLDAEPVLTALVRNVTARISPTGFETLVEKSKLIAGLQDPLARRADLPPELASRMCEWVSDALKQFIVRNYRIEPARLDKALTAAEVVVKSEPQAPQSPPAESAQKLIDKLSASGQLKAGFLLRVLHQGQIDLFDLAFAKLLGLSLVDARRKLYELGPKPVALACRAVGIDRCVFATVFNLSRQARNMRPVLTPAELGEVQKVFAEFTKPAALSALRTI
ncbi:MAG: DUF2336 domain-containing protein [Alphaproteobacteria bacterium]|nr:DUF2336 domain-containing protein [Alphaproteobacteria bacterium]